jgi:putative ABC transport system ATP-binding protein
MQQWTRIKEAEAESDLSLALVVDAELFRLDAVIRWLDAADGRIKRAAPGSPGEPSAAARPRVPRRRGTAIARQVTSSETGNGHEPREPDGGIAMSVLELRHVSRTYGQGAAEVHALADVDLAVEAGQMVAVMGPSGSGKSTLLTIAGSLEEPTSGEVLIGGAPLTKMSGNAKARLRRRWIGYVFQDFNLLPGLTAAENVALPLELDGTSARKAHLVGLKTLDDLGLGAKAGSFPDQLSGGERQRVAIARAVVGDRRLLLADEPSGALDSVNGEAVMRLIHAACKRGVAAVVVTHDAQLASWADRVVFLRDGRVTDHTAPLPGPESLLSGEQSR